MDIDIERLHKALEENDVSQYNIGILTDILLNYDNLEDNMKSTSNIYINEFKCLNDKSFIALLLNLMQFRFENITNEDVTNVEVEFEPDVEPQCDHEGEGEIDCEYEVRHDMWWCNTHNCYA